MQNGARTALSYCRFEVPGRPAFRVAPGIENDGISWYGQTGLDSGECGITIHRVVDQYDGPVKCTLGAADSVDEYNGVIHLTVARKSRHCL